MKFPGGQEIDFNRFSTPVRNVKHSLRDVFIQNMNTVWWEGNLLLDTDADGIPDEIETSSGSNPLELDSDKNGVSDGVETRVFGKSCKGSTCAPAAAEPFLACASLVKPNLPNGAKYGDLDRDGLNDCEEKIVLKSLHNDFDSNKDWIPDGLAFGLGVSFVPGQTERSLDPDGDLVATYQEIKQFTPPQFPNDRIVGLKPYNYDLSLVSNDSQRTCYHLVLKDLSIATASDLIRVTIVENTSVIDDKRFIRMGEKRISEGEVLFSQGDFQ